MADSTLTPEEQRFFETGELQPSMAPAPAPPADPVDPLALQGLGNVEPPATAPATTPATPPANEPSEQHTVSEATEILRRSLAEAQQRVGALEQFIQQQTQQPAKQNEEPAPDPSTDPLGAMMHKLESLNKQVLDLQTNLQTQTSQQTQLTQFQAFQQQVRSLRDEFAKTNADFPDAYKHVRDNRVADLRTLGYTDAQINQVIFTEEAALAESAIRQGKNPAEAIYEMAKRHGYAPKSVANQPVVPQKPDAKLAGIKAAQDAAKNLPKSPDVSDLTLEGLKDASDADLNKLVLDPKVWSKIVGSDQYPL